MSEREEVTRYRIGWNHEQRNDFVTCEFGEFVRYDDYAALRSQLAALKPMVDLATKEGEGLLAVGNELLRLQRCLTTAERERDEARRERDDYKAIYLDLWDAAKRHETEREALRHRAERAEAEAAYIRRAFRGAVESDALAVTYKTVGSYRAGLLKTINALDAAEAP